MSSTTSFISASANGNTPIASDATRLSTPIQETRVQQLVSAVFAYSQFNTIHLESQGVRDGIADLESQTQDLSERMRNLDIDTITKEARAKQNELFNSSFAP